MGASLVTAAHHTCATLTKKTGVSNQITQISINDGSIQSLTNLRTLSTALY